MVVYDCKYNKNRNRKTLRKIKKKSNEFVKVSGP